MQSLAEAEYEERRAHERALREAARMLAERNAENREDEIDKLVAEVEQRCQEGDESVKRSEGNRAQRRAAKHGKPDPEGDHAQRSRAKRTR